MQRKTKYYLIGLLILIVFIIGYHFYAAAQAEAQIDKTIQEQVAQNALTSTNVTYSSVDVSPFSGNIRFEDLSVTSPSGAHRSRSVSLDLAYLDFLRIYTADLQYGLEHLSQARIIFEQPLYISRNTIQEVRFDLIDMTFEGNAWDALLSLINSTPLKSAQVIRLTGESLTYSTQDTFPGTVKADMIYSEHQAPARSPQWQFRSEHRLSAKNIVWTPPLPIQEQYGFFIRGFGYETDHVPADSLKFSLTSSSADTSHLSLNLFTDLLDLEATSALRINRQSLAASRLVNGSVTVRNTSKEFDAFSQNLKQLFGINLSNQKGKLIRFSGPLKDPRFFIHP